MSADFKYSEDYPTRFVTFVRLLFWVKKWFRYLRVQKPITLILGPQYQPSSDLIEIDITYFCNLRCLNCNRSCTQAPSDEHMPLEMISKFVDDSINQRKVWRRIRVLGGEPTHHPEFNAIINELCRYQSTFPACKVEVVSNGHGRKTRNSLEGLPENIVIENTAKNSRVQPDFAPFNQAPQDQRKYRFADYSNGCAIMNECGIGLTSRGYYPCAVAGGIDRVLGVSHGRKMIPLKDDSMADLCESACRLCGRFEDGHYVPPKLRPRLETEVISTSWQDLYRAWKVRTDKEKDDPSKASHSK